MNNKEAIDELSVIYERPHGERRCYTCKYRACDITEMPCKECYRAYVDCYEEAENGND